MKEKKLLFDFAAFEFKNPVINQPSNMDIVLKGKRKDDGKQVLLFLESKFAEYYLYAAKKSTPISRRYASADFSRDLYNCETLKNIGLKDSNDPCDSNEEPKGKIVLEQVNPNAGMVYLDGIKQMISHYVGIRRRLRNNEKDCLTDDEKHNGAHEILSCLKDPDTKIYLGEILYEFRTVESINADLEPEAALTRYRALYTSLAEKMNSLIKDKGLSDRFTVLTKDLMYSDIVSSEMEQSIRDFYNL